MKKLSLILLTLCLSSIMSAQNILEDKIENDGFRILQTSYEPWAKKSIIKWEFSLFRNVNQTLNTFSERLIFQFVGYDEQRTLPAASKLYIKLDNDSILTLTLWKAIETWDNEAEFVETSLGISTHYYIYPEYILTPHDRAQLKQHKVIKMRFETTWGQGHFTLPRDDFKAKLSFSEKFVKMEQILDDAMSIKKNMLDDF